MVSISEKLNLKPQLSGADVKSLYEAEADTNAYTDTEKTSVSTALQPDQAETISGNYTFNGALILPNNSRVNGVEHFYQTTKPTVRGDSSALVAGDRWYKTDEGTEWFWNGTYWLSPPFDILLPRNTTSYSSNFQDQKRCTIPYNKYSNILLRYAMMGSRVESSTFYSVENDWQIECNMLVNTFPPLFSINFSDITPAPLYSWMYFTTSLNRVISNSNNNIIQVRGTKIGSPPSIFHLDISFSASYIFS